MSTTVKEDKFINPRKQNIYTKRWTPIQDDDPRAVVFIVHGAAEHCGYYDEIARRLTEENILVCSQDNVGHGRSEGSRLDIKSFTDYIEDLVQHVEIVKNTHPSCPFFAIGHSMGGTIVLKTSLDYPQLFKGIVLLGPAIVSNPETATPAKVFIARTIAKIIPQCPIAPFQSEWISRDPAVREKYDNDPLVHHGSVKARWAVCMMNTLDELQGRLAQVTWPFLVMHGEEDKLCEISGSKMLYQIATSTDKTLKTYPGGYHQVHNEPDGVGEGVVKDLVEWISTRI